MARQATVIYKGRVQGVGFRYTTRHQAADFKVTGYVMNLPDGSVEVVAEGEEQEIQSFLNRIETGPLGGFIRDRTLAWSEAENRFNSFTIRMT